MKIQLVVCAVVSLSAGIFIGSHYLPASNEQNTMRENEVNGHAGNENNIAHQKNSQSLFDESKQATTTVESTQVSKTTFASTNNHSVSPISNEDIETLQQEVARLKHQLESQQHAEKISEGYYRVEITKEELITSIPEPFTTTVSELTGNFAKNFVDYYEQEQQADWAYVVEDQIRDSINLHEQGVNIQLASVTCKSDACEIRGFQSDVSAWEKLRKI